MNFLIADTFTDSLARLTGDEQKAVKTTAFDLQMNPANPGMSLHKVDRARDKNFWSVRVNRDIRLIVHKTPSSLLLCYVDHHDKAYAWAERRKLETHPTTGAAQLVEIRETVQEILLPLYVQEEAAIAPASKPVSKPLFAHLENEEVLRYGVPQEWVDDVRQATEETYLALADHLPAEAAEALLEIATGGKPALPQPVVPDESPFAHPDAQRRFRVMANVEELERALEYPWEKWTVFLHPEQKQWAVRDYNGPARVSGSAGTGKTVVALHRAVHLARQNPDARVLLTTFSDPLANALRTKLRRLIGSEPRLGERIDVHSFRAIGERLYRAHCGAMKLADDSLIRELMRQAADEVGGIKFSPHFLLTEWLEVVDFRQVSSWEEYRVVPRLGRKTALPEAQRSILWKVFESVNGTIQEKGRITEAAMFGKLAATLVAKGGQPYDHVVVDEAQDLGIPHLKLFAALGATQANGLFFAGDLGQRIFQQPYSWKSLGVDIRGRSRNLRVNYRTSHQIRQQADRLLGEEVGDVDGNVEKRSGTVSVFNGPEPLIRVAATEEEEQSWIADWLREKASSGVVPQEMGVFVRSAAQLGRAEAAVRQAALPLRILDQESEPGSGSVSVCTMHLAKGLEFRAVVVMACDDEVIPSQARIESIADSADLQEIYDTERHLLYVACTRARDHLLISSTGPASEFLDDLQSRS